MSHISRRIRALVVIAVGSTHVAHAQAVQTATAGGTGGDAFSRTCAASRAMVGVRGSRTLVTLGVYVVGSITPLCVAIGADGSWIGTPTALSSAGKHDQYTFDEDLVCSNGGAVRGLALRTGFYVDQLKIICGTLGERGAIAFESGFSTGTFIGSDAGGQPAGPINCPTGLPASGIVGRAHDWVDRLGLICDTPDVPAPTTTRITASPSTVIGGAPVTLTIRLNAKALPAGAQVQLSRSVNIADVNKLPPNPTPTNPITIPSGAISGTLPFSTIPVITPVPVTIYTNSTLPNYTPGTFVILPPSMVALDPAVIRASPGAAASTVLTLNGDAPAGGITAALTSSVTATATVPPTVTIPAGANSMRIPITVAATNTWGCSVITASGLYAPQGDNGVRQAVLVVTRSGAPGFGMGIAATNPTITITYPAPVKLDRRVTLRSSNPALVSAPDAVIVPAGATTATFTIAAQSRPPSGTSCAVITAIDSEQLSNGITIAVDQTTLRHVK